MMFKWSNVFSSKEQGMDVGPPEADLDCDEGRDFCQGKSQTLEKEAQFGVVI